jgi:6,7-dimethyl-8-ribityllumazine synthase
MTKALPKTKDWFQFVVAEWNEEITEGLYNGAEAAFVDNEFRTYTLDGMFRSLSLFMAQKKCCKRRNVDAVM